MEEVMGSLFPQYKVEKQPSKYLMSGQAADYLGVTKETIKYYVRNGKLPYIREGDRPAKLFLKKDLDKIYKGKKWVNIHHTKMKYIT